MSHVCFEARLWFCFVNLTSFSTHSTHFLALFLFLTAPLCNLFQWYSSATCNDLSYLWHPPTSSWATKSQSAVFIDLSLCYRPAGSILQSLCCNWLCELRSYRYRFCSFYTSWYDFTHFQDARWGYWRASIWNDNYCDPTFEWFKLRINEDLQHVVVLHFDFAHNVHICARDDFCLLPLHFD